jgi:DNA modification methylase
MTTTAIVGTNADLIPHILDMYVREGSTIADVTFGKGAFWRNTDMSKYTLLASDLMEGLAPLRVDFRSLPYEAESINVLVLDPPYMHDTKPRGSNYPSDHYNNNNTSHESVIRLYAGGILEAARVLKKDGLILVKSQDETEASKQRFSHVELIQLLVMFGFTVIDLFVLVQTSTPILQIKEQKSARKNHSYMLIARFRR